jgi:hypothetical protein
MIVVDNSVICGFVISSDAYHAGAVACRDRDPEWHAPFLSRTEFRSVAGGRVSTVPSGLGDTRFVLTQC